MNLHCKIFKKQYKLKLNEISKVEKDKGLRVFMYEFAFKKFKKHNK